MNRAICSGDAPFCGPNTAAASTKRVVTSHATSRSTPARLAGVPTTSTAPQPPSVVAEPPQPMTMRLAPAWRARSMRWPTPAVSASTGSSPPGSGSNERPAAWDISITAVGPPSGPAARSRHSASVGAPSGPGTEVRCGVPPTARRRPSPPSDMGISSALHPTRRAAPPTAAATSAAVAVPRNLSGAAMRCDMGVEVTGWPNSPAQARGRTV